MLKRAGAILTNVASLDASQIEPIKRLLLAVIGRAARVARTLRIIWIAVGVIEMAMGAGFVLLLRQSDGTFGTASTVIGISFALLLILIGGLVYALSLLAGLPAVLDTIADTAIKLIGDAKSDYSAILEKRGWQGAIHTLWAAGRILISAKSALNEQEPYSRWLYVVIPLMTPPGWIAMVALAGACVLVPISAITVWVVRLFAV